MFFWFPWGSFHVCIASCRRKSGMKAQDNDTVAISPCELAGPEAVVKDILVKTLASEKRWGSLGE